MHRDPACRASGRSGDPSLGPGGSCRSGCARTGRPSRPGPCGRRPVRRLGFADAALSNSFAYAAPASQSPAILMLRLLGADVTTIPVGMMRQIRTAESVVLTCCPPAPDARIVSIRISDRGRMSISISSASGRTATVAADVCMRPLDFPSRAPVGRGGRPDSNFMRAKTPSPRIAADDFLVGRPAPPRLSSRIFDLPALKAFGKALHTSERGPRRTSAASSPPVPGRISRIAGRVIGGVLEARARRLQLLFKFGQVAPRGWRQSSRAGQARPSRGRPASRARSRDRGVRGLPRRRIDGRSTGRRARVFAPKRPRSPPGSDAAFSPCALRDRLQSVAGCLFSLSSGDHRLRVLPRGAVRPSRSSD